MLRQDAACRVWTCGWFDLFMSSGRSLDESWQGWLRENLQRGCNPAELAGILRQHGFSLPSIREHMGDAYVPDDALRPEPLQPPPLIRRSPANLRRIATDALELFTLESFLNTAECDRLVALIGHHLRPSTVTIDGTEKTFRTSRTCDLSLLRSPVALATDKKISQTLGIRAPYAEGIQAQRYDVGQQFKAHTDYFEPGTPEFEKFGGRRGNRTWTFMVYLNEGMQGGGTKFFAIDQVFQPRKGMAVLWNNLHPDRTPNAATLHSGEPVLQGSKVIITKWFREYGAGPMFEER